MAPRNRIRPLVAVRARRKLIQNPDDTSQAIVVIGALFGSSGKRLFRRFRRSPDAEAIRRERGDLYANLSDVPRRP